VPEVFMLDMNPVGPLPAIAALFMAIVTTYLITKLFGAPSEQGRFASIDVRKPFSSQPAP
jgi:hypothetical protein